MTTVIVDTGPLVALLSESDAAHDWAAKVFAGFEPPMLTCDVAITEAYHLLSKTRGGPDGLMALLETGALKLVSLAELGPTPLRQLLLRYRDVPMDFADACVVRLSELYPAAKVVTLDRDFLVYRRNNRQAIPLIAPPMR